MITRGGRGHKLPGPALPDKAGPDLFVVYGRGPHRPFIVTAVVLLPDKSWDLWLDPAWPCVEDLHRSSIKTALEVGAG